MTTKMKVAFNSKLSSTFSVINPLVLPVEGENVEFDWADFIDAPEDIAMLESYDGAWISNILSKRYHREGVDIYIVLFESDDYSKVFPNRYYSANI